MTFPPTVTTIRDGFASIEIGWSGPGIFIGLSAMICLLVNWKWYLGIQKPRHVSDEQRGILVMRAVCGVRIDDQLRVRQVLLQDERVHRVNDDIIAAVHDQRWLLDSLQIVVRTLARSGPLGDGRALCRRYLFVHFGIAIL